jgi:hypothetical protein
MIFFCDSLLVSIQQIEGRGGEGGMVGREGGGGGGIAREN